MPIFKSMVGCTGPVVTDVLTDRWVSNYAAAVGDESAVYYDNRGAQAMPAHPAYVSHLEWDAIAGLHEAHLSALTPEERVHGVHVFNSTKLHRPLRAGDALESRAIVAGVERHRAGAQLVIRIDTTDAARKPVATSYTSTIFRGVGLDDERAPAEHGALGLPARAEPGGNPARTQNIAITPLAPYVFSECARDYGAIHTDRKVAAQAGLPGLILHGTGTIAYALSVLTQHEAGGDPTRVRGFQVRLTGMVMCPSVMTLRVFASRTRGVVPFDALTDDGKPALSDGYLVLGDAQ